MAVQCPSCHAFHWMDKKLTKSSKIKPLFGSCCLLGKVMLPTLLRPPQPIYELYNGDDYLSRSFQEHIREYNAAHTFTSLGVQQDDRVIPGSGPLSFTIHGELRHQTGSLTPLERSHAYCSETIGIGLTSTS